MVKTQSPVGGLPEFARTALTVASDGCYWAVTDLKRDHDRKIGVEKSSCTTYDDKDRPAMGAGRSIWEMSDKVYETDSNFVNKPMSLSVLGGLRYTHLDLDVDITATPAIADRSGSKDWVDPFVGFRSTIQWTRRWSSSVRFDIGGFGVGSDLAARGKSRTEAKKSSMPTKKFSMHSKKGPNLVIAKRAPSGHCARCGNLDFYHGLLAYQIATIQKIEINERFDFVFGYRHLSYDYDDGSGASKFEFDTTLSGPMLGMNIKF